MSYRIFIVTAITFCLCGRALFAPCQCPGSAELNITATLYTQESGLATSMLDVVVKDSIGYRYFLGVDYKWNRYDGVNFYVTHYRHPSPFYHIGLKENSTDNYTTQYINTILYKYENNKNETNYKWALAGDSLVWEDVPGNRKALFLLPKELRTNPVTNFFPNGNICWFTTTEKVFRFDVRSKKFLSIPLPPFLTVKALEREALFIFFRSDGSCYLLTKNMLMKLNRQSSFFEKFCVFSSQTDFVLRCEIIMDSYLFITELDNHFYEIDLDNGTLKTFDLMDYTRISNSSALKITTVKNYNDHLLIGTANAGLFIFNRCTNSMQHFQYQKQSAGTDLTNSVVWITVDDENVVWMQTEAGLLKLEVNDQLIKTYIPSSVKHDGVCNNCNNVRAIYGQDNNNLLIGSLEGIYTFDLTTGRLGNLISPVDKLPVWNNQPVSAITVDGNQNIFISHWGNDGILLVNSEKKKLVNILPVKDHPDFSFNYLRCLYYDSHHVLWAGTNEGFLRITNLDEFEKNDFKGKLNVSNLFPGEHNRSFLRTGFCFTITGDSNDNIWMGTTEGLFIYNYRTDSIIKYDHVPGNNQSLSDNEVRSICVSKNGDAWIGTNTGGLNHFAVSTKKFTAFTTENGLPNNSVYTILEDHNGRLWLGTNAGLCRFDKTDHSVRNYTPRDGAQNLEFNTNAVFKTADGRFSFGGRTGFNIFHPDSMNVTFSPPKVVITRFRIFDKEFPVTNAVLHLAHNENSFTFEFAALNYYRSNDNQYAYMMENADKDWIKSGNRQYTSYTNLPPGKYTFKVRAANYTGSWNEGITTMHFIINPAWYNTWWLRLALVFLIAAGIYGLYRYRLNQVRKLQAVRNRIASDLHDEIGSTLSSISISSTIIQGKLNGTNTEVEELLQQVSHNTDTMMEALSDIVWAINTRNDRFDNVVNRMRALAVEILEPCNVNIRFNVGEGIGDVHLDMQQRKNLYLIFKEAINNIVKYSGCKNVCIDISRQGNKTFVLGIEDDGKGFELTALNRDGISLSGNGIRNMKKRAEELGGEMTIESVCGHGTRLNLTFTI